MPIHDWTRVRANRFHDFHQSWTIAIRNVLNAGLLPPGYFALVEEKTGGTEAHTINRNPTDAANYASKANRVTICRPDGTMAAVLEIVSPGNKDNRYALRAFTRKAVEFLQAGVHLLIVDLFPARRRDPQGVSARSNLFDGLAAVSGPTSWTLGVAAVAMNERPRIFIPG